MRIARFTPAVVALAAACAAGLARAACPSDVEAAALAARFEALTPIATPGPELTMADAVCGRDKLARFLAQRQGKVVGYKAGLTAPGTQKRFAWNEPIRGTLFANMILRDGAELGPKFATRPVFEGDLVVEVKDAGVMNAKTPAEVLRHIARVYPFIEVPDLLVDDPAKLMGPGLQLLNVAARFGVLGNPVEVQQSKAFLDALATMTVKLVDQTGKTLDEGKGSAILEHPLNAVIWLAGDLKKSGIALRRGDLLSLGSFTRLLPPQPGTTIRAVYEGLPGNPSVSVRFR